MASWWAKQLKRQLQWLDLRKYSTVVIIYSFVVMIVLFMFSGERVRMVRPVKVDGEARMVTMDYRTDRINVETENGKIVKIVGAN